MFRRSLCLGLITLSVALSAAPQDPPPQPPVQPPQDPAALAALRVEAGMKAYELAWLYYSENRIPSEKVYRWSRWLYEAQRDSSADKAAQVAASEAHLERIKKLEFKIRRIRKIGFGDSLDVAEVDYYRKEADLWLAQAKALK